jgi:aminoglycoside 6'-N-acetyltransferase
MVRPTLVDGGVRVRPGRQVDVDVLRSIMQQPAVARWWGSAEERAEVEGKLLGDSYAILLVVEADERIAGGIEYWEENEPDYRHAGIDIYLAGEHQSRGVGTVAIGLLVDFLFDVRGHHRDRKSVV